MRRSGMLTRQRSTPCGPGSPRRHLGDLEADAGELVRPELAQVLDRGGDARVEELGSGAQHIEVRPGHRGAQTAPVPVVRARAGRGAANGSGHVGKSRSAPLGGRSILTP